MSNINFKGIHIDLKYVYGFAAGVLASIIYNMDKQKTKKILLQKSTIVGIIQVAAGFYLMYDGHREIGGGLITAGFAMIVYQGKD